ncbi:MAG: hypothetical protein AVDCRST_MAG65-2259, partial [uncultured Solirubrobacteraceae bacterium]
WVPDSHFSTVSRSSSRRPSALLSSDRPCTRAGDRRRTVATARTDPKREGARWRPTSTRSSRASSIRPPCRGPGERIPPTAASSRAPATASPAPPSL